MEGSQVKYHYFEVLSTQNCHCIFKDLKNSSEYGYLELLEFLEVWCVGEEFHVRCMDWPGGCVQCQAPRHRVLSIPLEWCSVGSARLPGTGCYPSLWNGAACAHSPAQPLLPGISILLHKGWSRALCWVSCAVLKAGTEADPVTNHRQAREWRCLFPEHLKLREDKQPGSLGTSFPALSFPGNTRDYAQEAASVSDVVHLINQNILLEGS